ncbi:unnamed protein product [Arctia plantaginis]|uniref:Ubiquitin-like domain-containing protein n=1 Tax=Arctia plantaginis TaxID=874455 RepID=A0A8S1AAR7_ARCPL|nr:unnamed protein product [Arctia plantaginis]
MAVTTGWRGKMKYGSRKAHVPLINLRLILVSGKTKEFVFSPVDSAGDIAIHVYDNWPEADWASEMVSRAEILRLIYQGRFLHSSVTLGALGLPMGRTTKYDGVNLTYPFSVSFFLPINPIKGKKVKVAQAVVVHHLAAYCNGSACEGNAHTRAAMGASERGDTVPGDGLQCVQCRSQDTMSPRTKSCDVFKRNLTN